MSGNPKDYRPRRGRGPGLQRTVTGDPDLQRSISRLAEYLDGGPDTIQRVALDAFGVLFGPKKAPGDRYVLAGGYAYFEEATGILTSAPYTNRKVTVYFDGRVTAGADLQNARAVSFFGDPNFRIPQPIVLAVPLYLIKGGLRGSVPPYDYTWEVTTDIMESAVKSPHRKKRFLYSVFSTGNHEIAVGDYWELFWLAFGHGAGEEGSKQA